VTGRSRSWAARAGRLLSSRPGWTKWKDAGARDSVEQAVSGDQGQVEHLGGGEEEPVHRVGVMGGELPARENDLRPDVGNLERPPRQRLANPRFAAGVDLDAAPLGQHQRFPDAE
jgi:hypothetical protein